MTPQTIEEWEAFYRGRLARERLADDERAKIEQELKTLQEEKEASDRAEAAEIERGRERYEDGSLL